MLKYSLPFLNYYELLSLKTRKQTHLVYSALIPVYNWSQVLYGPVTQEDLVDKSILEATLVPVCLFITCHFSVSAAVLQCILACILGCMTGWACPCLRCLKCNFIKWSLCQVFQSLERIKAGYLFRDVSQPCLY